MICPCGGVCVGYETKGGWVQKCPACGRYEVFPRRLAQGDGPAADAVAHEPVQADLLSATNRNKA